MRLTNGRLLTITLAHHTNDRKLIFPYLCLFVSVYFFLVTFYYHYWLSLFALCAYLFTLSVCLPEFLPTCLLYASLPACPPACPSVSSTVCLYACLSTCLLTRLSVFLLFYLSVYLSTRLYTTTFKPSYNIGQSTARLLFHYSNTRTRL